VSDKESVRIDDLIAKIPESQWSVLKVRKSTKGQIKYEYAQTKVWIWVKESGKTYQWHLIARRNADTKKDYKYSLSNAPEKTSLKTLAYFQAQRYWIERVFEDYKGCCGMSDYEVRSWSGWYHHMAMVMIAGLFVLSEKLRSNEDGITLTCSDVEFLLSKYLPKRIVSDDEIISELYRRIKFREMLYNSYEEQVFS